MNRKTLILTEDQVKKVVDNLLEEQTYTDFDPTYDYKLSGNMWYASRKGENKWMSLKNTPGAIQKLNTKYGKNVSTGKTTTPQARTKTVSTTKQVNGIPFQNKTEGNEFRAWFNNNFPEKARALKLDPQGSFNNSYIKRAYNTTLSSNGKTAGQMFQDSKVKPDAKKEDEGGFFSDIGDTISSWFSSSGQGIRKFMRKLAPNVAQMFFTRPLTGADFSKKQKMVIYNVIQNSINRTKRENHGITNYADYGEYIKDSFDNRVGAKTKDIITKSVTDPYFQVASTLGAFTYKKQKDGTYNVSDIYDFSKGIGYTVKKEEIEGMPYLKQLQYVMKKDDLTPYRAARQIAYLEHPDTAPEEEKVRINLTIDPQEFASETSVA